jgi:5-oxopent-3-ene-1,2,5-tricarboxylate decarboxylase/2-hydroxyhepta-2,4-diene-1,7-dioate isomerase
VLSSIPVTGTVYGVALNFRQSLAKLDQPPRSAVLYIKPANTYSVPGAPVPCPPGIPALRMGGTLAAVIGTTASRVTAREALAHVAGYTVVNDVSIPEDSYFRPPIRQRCRDGFCPIGSPVMPAAEVARPESLIVRILVNGEVRCRAPLAELVRPLDMLIAEISEFLTLRGGDLLLVGEPPDAPLARVGDLVRVEVEGVGELENRVLAEGTGPEARPT